MALFEVVEPTVLPLFPDDVPLAFVWFLSRTILLLTSQHRLEAAALEPELVPVPCAFATPTTAMNAVPVITARKILLMLIPPLVDGENAENAQCRDQNGVPLILQGCAPYSAIRLLLVAPSPNPAAGLSFFGADTAAAQWCHRGLDPVTDCNEALRVIRYPRWPSRDSAGGALTEEPAMRVGVTTMKVSSGAEPRSASSTKTATAIAPVGKRSELDRAATARFAKKWPR
jgi:hypothetical protein